MSNAEGRGTESVCSFVSEIKKAGTEVPAVQLLIVAAR